MPDSMTVTLNNTFEHAQCLDTIFWSDQDAKLDMHIQEHKE